MAKNMLGWTVMVIMQTAKATTIDIAASDLTTVNTVEVNMNTQGEGGFSRVMNTIDEDEGFTQEVGGFSRGVNVGRDERGCRRKNGQVR